MAETKKNAEVRLLEPRATEKAYGEQTKRTYIFPVKKTMSKQAIAQEVEREFGVKVVEVQTLIRKGRKMRCIKGKRSHVGVTQRRDQKFAYVRLAEGDSIQVFDRDDTKEAATEKVAEKATEPEAEGKKTKKVEKKAEAEEIEAEETEAEAEEADEMETDETEEAEPEAEEKTEKEDEE